MTRDGERGASLEEDRGVGDRGLEVGVEQGEA